MDILDLKEELQLKEVVGGTVGEVNGYYFSVYNGKIGSFAGRFLMFTMNQSITNADLRNIRKEAKQLFYTQTAIRKNDTVCVIVPKRIKDADKYLKVLTRLTQGFKVAAIKQSTQCFVCGGSSEFDVEEAGLSVRNGFPLISHTGCIEKYNAHLEKQEEAENANRSKLPISLVLCIIGAFVGLLPNLILLLAAEFMFGYAFALIPLGAFFGYKMGGAPLRKESTVIIVTVSILTCLGMAAFYILLLSSWSGLSIPEMFTNSELSAAILGDLLFMLVFAALGIGLGWRLITNANKPKRL